MYFDFTVVFVTNSSLLFNLAMAIMAIPVVEFSNGVYKIRKIFAQKSTYPKEIIEIWELD